MHLGGAAEFSTFRRTLAAGGSVRRSRHRAPLWAGWLTDVEFFFVTESFGDAHRPHRKSPAGGANFDVLVTGRLFYEIVFGNVPKLPDKGEEIYASDFVTCPGGAANRAVACVRLGLSTRLSTDFGDDLEGDSCRNFLLAEGIDLTTSRRHPNWRTPVTVSVALDGDRAMLTHALAPPGSDFAGLHDECDSSWVLVELDPTGEMSPLNKIWLKAAREANAKTFVTASFDSTGRWPAKLLAQLDGLDAVLLNETESLRYTDTESVTRALGVLSEIVPLVIITRGANGAVGHDGTTGETAKVPALPTAVRDATGAGDVFAGAVVYGMLHAWPLMQCLALGSLCSHLAIQRIGSSVSCPTWQDIRDWWSRLEREIAVTNSPEEIAATRDRYNFLKDLDAASADL
jgi:sugar/nucleoside kinase (ribokinase family)